MFACDWNDHLLWMNGLAGTNSLTHLAGTQLKASRNGVDPADVPRFFGSARDIVQLGMHTVNDASLVQR